MARWAQPSASITPPASCLAVIAVPIRATVNVGSPTASSSSTSSVEIRPASRRLALKNSSMICPHIPIASDRLSPAAMHNSRSSSNPEPAVLTERNAVAHSRLRGAMRIDSRPDRRQGGDLPRSAPYANSAMRPRCHEGLTTNPLACASRTPHADHLRPHSAGRSARRSRRPSPDRVVRSSRPNADAVAHDRI